VATSLEVGYQAVCTSRPWPARPGARTVNRIAIYPEPTLHRFSAILAGPRLACLPEAARAALTWAPKRMLLKLRPATLGVHRVAEGA
jgi:hypothetical protein